MVHEIIFRSLWRQLSVSSSFKEKVLNFGRFLFFKLEEINALKDFDLIIAMSNEDRLYLNQFTKRRDIEIIPNGVNTAGFSFSKDICPSRQLYFIGWFKSIGLSRMASFFQPLSYSSVRVWQLIYIGLKGGQGSNLHEL